MAGAHGGREREVDGAPFVVHPLEVALLLHGAGCSEEAVIAGLLHDVVENGSVTVEDVASAFGAAIAGIVAALTEDDRVDGYDARKAELRARVAATGDDETLLVFAADKLVKARELRVVAAGDGAPAREVAPKRAHYAGCLEVVERRLPAHPLTAGLRFELCAQPLVPALRWLPSPAALA